MQSARLGGGGGGGGGGVAGRGLWVVRFLCLVLPMLVPLFVFVCSEDFSVFSKKFLTCGFYRFSCVGHFVVCLGSLSCVLFSRSVLLVVLGIGCFL